MMSVLGRDNVCKEIAEALGIKHCRSLTIKIRLDSIVTVEAEFFPEIDGVQQLKPIFKKYKLVEK